MELRLVRRTFKESHTISDLYIDGVKFCEVLEDTDRGLDASMPLEEIKAKKVYGRTAIPYGKYEIAISYSTKFAKLLPLILNVPGYKGIRIHPGNYAEDTLGCLLPGKEKGNSVVESRITFTKLFSLIKRRSKYEKVFIEITK